MPSRNERILAASLLFCPQTNSSALNPLQTDGREGWSNIWHFISSSRWMQRTPPAFPPGIPGMGEDMDGMMQHAPHFWRHSKFEFIS